MIDEVGLDLRPPTSRDDWDFTEQSQENEEQDQENDAGGDENYEESNSMEEDDRILEWDREGSTASWRLTLSPADAEHATRFHDQRGYTGRPVLAASYKDHATRSTIMTTELKDILDRHYSSLGMLDAGSTRSESDFGMVKVG